MQTIFYETTNFIRHRGNVVDLGAYRQKLGAVSGENWGAGQTVEAEPAETFQVTTEERAVVLHLLEPQAEAPRPKARKRKRLCWLPLCFDFCATVAVVALTLTAVLQFLRLG